MRKWGLNFEYFFIISEYDQRDDPFKIATAYFTNYSNWSNFAFFDIWTVYRSGVSWGWTEREEAITTLGLSTYTTI